MERDDQDILTGLQRGERGAFDALYTRYRGRLYGFLLRLSGRRDTAEDLFQETWIKASRAATRLRDDTNLPAWLFTIARNAYVSHRRWSMLDLSRLVALGDEVAYTSDAQDPEERTEASQTMAALESALGRLSASQREVLLLVGVEGFDQEQAAEILGIRYDTFRQRLSRARAQLAENLAENERTS